MRITNSIDCLSTDVFKEICTFLDIEELIKQPLVCKKWQIIDEIWKNYAAKRLPDRIKKLPKLTPIEKVKAYYQILKKQVDFVKQNSCLRINVYLFSSPGGDLLFSRRLLKDLDDTGKSLLWKTERIKNCINNAPFSSRREKIAEYKFTHINTENDSDLKEIDTLLDLGLDVNSGLSSHENQYPTSLFTLFGYAANSYNIEKIIIIAKKLMDYDLNTKTTNDLGQNAFEFALSLNILPENKIKELKKYGKSA